MNIIKTALRAIRQRAFGKTRKCLPSLLAFVLAIAVLFFGGTTVSEIVSKDNVAEKARQLLDDYDAYRRFLLLGDLPAYTGEPSVAVLDDFPDFSAEDFDVGWNYQEFSELDSYGRCGPAIAVVGQESFPSEERGRIGMVKPSGWQISKYDFVDQKYLYNRCHLIGYQLTGVNADERNLITGTRYMNVEGMLPLENRVADYIRTTGNHVLYRVTPIFEDENLVASGVLMEAMSVEDGGESLRFCRFCYNVQPGVVIDYATGQNWLEAENNE